MITHSSYTSHGGALESARTKKDIGRKAVEVALALLFVAALTGAWLAFFTFVPFDVTPPRPS
jgi:hypothetical protein